MGICASCLGLNRRSSQAYENDPLLDNQHTQYGSLGVGDVSQPDEEELRREREHLDQITTEATDNMIDVLHPGNTELGRRFANPVSTRKLHVEEHEDAGEDRTSEDEEAAWLQSVQASADGDNGGVQGVESGHFFMNTSQLRIDSAAVTQSKTLKGKQRAS